MSERSDKIFEEQIDKRSQDSPILFCPTGAIWWAKANVLKQQKTLALVSIKLSIGMLALTSFSLTFAILMVVTSLKRVDFWYAILMKDVTHASVEIAAIGRKSGATMEYGGQKAIAKAHAD